MCVKYVESDIMIMCKLSSGRLQEFGIQWTMLWVNKRSIQSSYLDVKQLTNYLSLRMLLVNMLIILFFEVYEFIYSLLNYLSQIFHMQRTC